MLFFFSAVKSLNLLVSVEADGGGEGENLLSHLRQEDIVSYHDWGLFKVTVNPQVYPLLCSHLVMLGNQHG